MTIKKDGNVLTVERPNDEKENRSLHGLTRTLLNNMVIGVSAVSYTHLEHASAQHIKRMAKGRFQSNRSIDCDTSPRKQLRL